MKKIVTILMALVVSFMGMAQKENLGTNVNSSTHEIAAYITPDGSKLFFIRSGDHPDHTMHGLSQDVWMSHMENDSAVTVGKHLGFPFNRTNYNSIDYQSVDGQLRIIKGVYNRYMQYKKNGYSYSILKKNGWSNPKEIKIKDYEDMTKGKYASMCMAPSGNYMILSFSETKGDDMEYLYLSRRINDEKWTRPEKMPFTIHGDFGAYMASDNKTLYFSSYSRKGYGSSDIYVTKRLDDTWKNWSEPINLGPNINSEGREAYFIVSPTGRYAFVAGGDGIGGSVDLYRIPLFKKEESKTEEKVEEVVVEEAKPDPVVIVEGIVKNAETGEPMQASLEYMNLNTNSLEGIARSSEVDGSYKVVLAYGSKYGIEANKQGFYSQNVGVDLTDIGEFKVIKRDILMTPFKVAAVIRLNNIFFETAKATLLQESQMELDNLVKILNENPKMKIEIRGHTDNVGSDAANQTLSENRAKSVVDYLVSKGISASRLTSAGFGEKQPEATNDTEEGRAINRRVEFKIISIK
ncbi:MAG TPA: OmpA family protein [Crocinitomicaceae bacterium]|nr:OmpA family protein [Crocinitomicaceae bacterium]